MDSARVGWIKPRHRRIRALRALIRPTAKTAARSPQRVEPAIFGKRPNGFRLSQERRQEETRQCPTHVMNAVITKSNARITIAENTTVRVVEYATPSLVGGAV